MSARQAALAVALVFITAEVALAQDDRAVPRGGGSSGGSGRDHHSGASSSREGGSSSGGSVSQGGSSSHEPTAAQRRHPRAGTGTGHRRGGSSYYYGSPYYRSRYYGYGYYGSPYYGGWGIGYSPYYYSGFYGYSPYYYGGGRGYRAGALRVMVEPNETRVYVDGYYAGVADDFDGIFQRLHLAPGRHDLSLRLDGYRTQNFKVYVPYDHTIKIHHKMAPGSPTDVSEETLGRPEDVADAGREGDYDRYDGDDEGGFDADERDLDDLGRGNTRGKAGTLRLSVRPSDASVYVDGTFRGTGRLRTLRLPAGRHRIEVVRPGYRTLEREVDVEPGRQVEVSFDLERS